MKKHQVGMCAHVDYKLFNVKNKFHLGVINLFFLFLCELGAVCWVSSSQVAVAGIWVAAACSSLNEMLYVAGC